LFGLWQIIGISIFCHDFWLAASQLWGASLLAFCGEKPFFLRNFGSSESSKQWTITEISKSQKKKEHGAAESGKPQKAKSGVAAPQSEASQKWRSHALKAAQPRPVAEGRPTAKGGSTDDAN